VTRNPRNASVSVAPGLLGRSAGLWHGADQGAGLRRAGGRPSGPHPRRASLRGAIPALFIRGGSDYSQAVLTKEQRKAVDRDREELRKRSPDTPVMTHEEWLRWHEEIRSYRILNWEEMLLNMR